MVIKTIKIEHVTNEEALDCIENLLASADSVDYFDLNCNVEIVNFFLEYRDPVTEIEVNETNFLLLSSSPGDDANKIGGEKAHQVNIDPLRGDKHEEKNHKNDKKKSNAKPSSFITKTKENSFIVDETKNKNCKKIKLKKFHKFLNKFKKEFKEFKNVVTIPVFVNANETKYFEVKIKITDLFNDNFIIYEYIINDVTKFKFSETMESDIKITSLSFDKIAQNLKNHLITILNLSQSITSKVKQLQFINNGSLEHQSSDEDSEEEKPSSINKITRSNTCINSVQETITLIVNTGNSMISLIEDEIDNINKESYGMDESVSTNKICLYPVITKSMKDFDLLSNNKTLGDSRKSLNFKEFKDFTCAETKIF